MNALMVSQQVYNYFNNEPIDLLCRYLRILKPRGVIQSILTLVDYNRQAKIACLEDILASRRNEFYKNRTGVSMNEIKIIVMKKYYHEVNIMTSDYDQNFAECNEKVHEKGTVSAMISKGYLK